MGGKGLHLVDFTKQVAHQVNIMDQIDQQRSRAGFTAPGNVKIIIRLLQYPVRGDGDDLPEFAAVDRCLRRGDQRVMPPVVPYQHRNLMASSGIDQFPGALRRVGDGLFDQHRDPAFDAGQSTGQVQNIGRGVNHPLRLDRVQHGFNVVIPCDTQRLRQRLRLR